MVNDLLFSHKYIYIFGDFYVFNILHHFTSKGLYSQSSGLSNSHVWMWVLVHKESWGAEELTLPNCGSREDFWESLGLQGHQTNQSQRKSVLNIHCKDWCSNSNPLATWCEEPAHWKSPWYWWWLKAKEEGSSRGWDGQIASLTQWT